MRLELANLIMDAADEWTGVYVDLLEEYRGRGTGTPTTALKFESVTDAFQALHALALYAHGIPRLDELKALESIPNYRIDNMGKGVIVY